MAKVTAAPKRPMKMVTGDQSRCSASSNRTIPAPETSGTSPSSLKLISSVVRMLEQISAYRLSAVRALADLLASWCRSRLCPLVLVGHLVGALPSEPKWEAFEVSAYSYVVALASCGPVIATIPSWKAAAAIDPMTSQGNPLVASPMASTLSDSPPDDKSRTMTIAKT
jgi:hypothetical protein